MTRSSGPARSVSRAQAGAGALAGLVQGIGLAALVVAFAWYLLGGWAPSQQTPSQQTLGGWLLVAVSVLVLAGAWFAGVAVLRRRGMQRARSIVSWSLALSSVAVTVLALLAGWVAIVIGLFSALVLWTGEYAETVAVTAVVIVAALALLVGTATCSLFTVAFANRLPTESGPAGPPAPPSDAPRL
ncbi:hypothetical protein [Herbiconiux liangxiaofengii]|uniref:hypothetical protein n=1 Tax=Herbiconiux liangxiaofengii TaxID=3342795 RepID=UPI0035BAF572